MLSAMDESVDPCDDFFDYACGTWNRVHVIPDDKASYNTLIKLGDDVSTKVKGKVELLDPKSNNKSYLTLNKRQQEHSTTVTVARTPL